MMLLEPLIHAAMSQWQEAHKGCTFAMILPLLRDVKYAQHIVL